MARSADVTTDEFVMAARLALWSGAHHPAIDIAAEPTLVGHRTWLLATAHSRKQSVRQEATVHEARVHGIAEVKEPGSRSAYSDSPGRAYMRVGASLSAVLLMASVLLVAETSKAAGMLLLWLAGATFFFCNFASARLRYPYYIVGPAVAMLASLGCLGLALTTVVAALFD